MSEKLLIKNVTMLTFFNDGYNAIKIQVTDILLKNGLIEQIDKNIEDSCKTIDGTGKLAVPGFVNSRSRSLVSKVSKSIAEDVNLDKYGNSPLYTMVNPFVNISLDVLNDEELKSILEIAIYEAIDSGTTTLIEQCVGRELPLYLELCEEYGLRTFAAPMLMSRKSLPEADAWGNFDLCLQEVDEQELVDWNCSLVEKYKNNDLVKASMGLGSADTVSERLIAKVAKNAFESNSILMIPANETLREREICQERYGLSPIEVLHKNHALSRKTLLGGLIYTTKEDRRIIKNMSSQAVVCQYQGMLDAVLSPFIDFLIDDINTAIGTGRCSINMLEQLRMSAIAGKLQFGKRYQMRASDAFYASTEAGGRAIDMNIGRLEEGCKADILLVDLSNPSFHPFVMPVKELIYNTKTLDISEVIINGKLLKQDGKVLLADKKNIVMRSEKAMEKVWQRAREIGVL